MTHVTHAPPLPSPLPPPPERGREGGGSDAYGHYITSLLDAVLFRLLISARVPGHMILKFGQAYGHSTPQLINVKNFQPNPS